MLIPNTFFEERDIVSLSCIKEVNEKDVSTKARPIQMNEEWLVYCQKEKQKQNTNFLKKQVSLELCSKSSWVRKRCTHDQLQIFQWIRYPIPNKKGLFRKLVPSKDFLILTWSWDLNSNSGTRWAKKNKILLYIFS